uniref:Peptidase A1 domain-containing protein n=1 Tax=Oryza brachyantha TaxID=4533 RepID=J3MFR8_ORYBR
MTVVHRHGPCSPLADAHDGKPPSHEEILAADQNRAESIQHRGFRFGCGERNEGLFGGAAGLLGLGRGKTSLPVQTYDKYGGVFAHCFPARSSGTGYLEFGPGSSPAVSAKLSTTPMLIDTGPTFYYVGMTGIRVGGKLLPIPQSVFAAAGTIVDSGTVITRLPPAAYSSLRSAFAASMAARGYKRAPALSLLDTCYDLTGASEVAIPTVSLLFQGGVSLDVDASGIIYAASVSQACLGFAGNEAADDVAIVGNTQLKTFGVVYDIASKVVGFCPGAC